MLVLGHEQLEALRTGLRDSRADLFLWELTSRQLAAEWVENAIKALVGGGETILAFDENGCPKQLQLASGRRYAFKYDGGQLVLFQSGDERVDIQRDPSGRVVGARASHGAGFELAYDACDRVTSVQRSDGRTHSYVYDRDGVLASQTRGPDTFAYHRAPGGQLRAIDGVVVGTLQFDDTGGRLRSVLFPDGTSRAFRLDPAQGVALLTLRDDSVVSHRMSSAGVVERVTWPDRRFLDLQWRGEELVAVHTASSRVMFTWHRNGGIAMETSETGACRSAYNEGGHLAEVILSNGDKIHYRYDEQDRLTEIEAWGVSQRMSYQGDDVCVRRVGDEIVEHLRFSKGRLESARVTAGGRVIGEQRYRYDVNGRLVEQQNLAALAADSWTEEIRYDPSGRVAMTRLIGDTATALEHRYDERSRLVRRGAKVIVRGMMDEIVEIGTDLIKYDKLGRVVRLPGAGEQLTSVFNADGTLARTTIGSLTVDYAYDGLGRRTKKRVGGEGRSDTIETRYGWSRHQLLFEERDGAEGPTRRDYLYGIDGSSPVAFREGGRIYWLQHDCRGAVVRLFRSDGALAWRGRYDVWGRATVDVAHVRQPFRFAGHYEDEETGLHYALGRYFSPVIGAYLTPKQDIASAPRRYDYAAGDPFNHVDVVGLSTVPVPPVGVRFDIMNTLREVESELVGADPLLRAANAGFATAGVMSQALVDLAIGRDGAVARILWSRLAREAVSGDPIRMLETEPNPNALLHVVRRLMRKRRAPFQQLSALSAEMMQWAQ